MGFFSQIVSESRRGSIGLLGPAPVASAVESSVPATDLVPEIQRNAGRATAATPSHAAVLKSTVAELDAHTVTPPATSTHAVNAEREKDTLSTRARKSRAKAASVVHPHTSSTSVAKADKKSVDKSLTSIHAASANAVDGADSQHWSSTVTPGSKIKSALKIQSERRLQPVEQGTLHTLHEHYTSNEQLENRDSKTGIPEDENRNPVHPTPTRAQDQTAVDATVQRAKVTSTNYADPQPQPQFNAELTSALPTAGPRRNPQSQIAVSAPQVRIGQINVMVEGKTAKNPPAAVREQDSSSRLFLRGL